MVPAGHRREDTDALNAPVSSNAPWFAEIARQRDPNDRHYAWDGYHLGEEAYCVLKGGMTNQDAALFRTCDWVGKMEARNYFIGPATRAIEQTITATSQSARGYVPVSQNRYEDISCVLYLFVFLVCV